MKSLPIFNHGTAQNKHIHAIKEDLLCWLGQASNASTRLTSPGYDVERSRHRLTTPIHDKTWSIGYLMRQGVRSQPWLCHISAKMWGDNTKNLLDLIHEQVVLQFHTTINSEGKTTKAKNGREVAHASPIKTNQISTSFDVACYYVRPRHKRLIITTS